jgi:hypothetical protein
MSKLSKYQLLFHIEVIYLQYQGYFDMNFFIYGINNQLWLSLNFTLNLNVCIRKMLLEEEP